MKAKIVIVVYFQILATIVYLANQGALPDSISFYRKLPFGDAVGHFILMGIFSLLATIISSQHRIRLFHFHIPVGPLLVMMIVFAEEVSQIFLPNRTFSLQDLIADVAGIITFAWLGLRWSIQSTSRRAEKFNEAKTTMVNKD